MYVCNKKSNLLVVGALIVLWAITILSLFFKSFYLNVWIGIIIVVLSIILTSKKYGIFSIPTLFIALSYLFHCFQFCLYVLKIEYNVAFNIIEVLGFEIATKIVRFFNIAICSLTTGFISVKNRKINTNCKYYNDETIRLYGRVFCILFFLPRIYIDILNVIYFFKFGYESTFQVTSVGILSTLGYGFYLGVILLIVGNRNNKINAKKILIVFSVYLIISMFSGRRMEQTAILLTCFFVYYKYISHFKIKSIKFLFVALILYLCIVIVSTLGDLRYTDILSISTYFNKFLENLSGKLVYNQLAEFGDTGISLGYAIKYFGKEVQYNYGLSYVNSWTQVLPNINNILNEYFASDYSFVQALPLNEHANFGCSYLGELYYNFGFAGAFFTFFIGMIIGKIANIINSSLTSELSFGSIIFLFITPAIFTFIRGSFSDFIRIGVWFGFFILILNSIKLTRASMESNSHI